MGLLDRIEHELVRPALRWARPSRHVQFAGIRHQLPKRARWRRRRHGKPAGSGFDHYRSLLDPTLTILLPADKVPPFRFKAGGWELLQSSIEGRR
jgi:hypothetical protein